MGKGKPRNKRSSYGDKMTNQVNTLGRDLFFSLTNQQKNTSSIANQEKLLPNTPPADKKVIPENIEDMNVAFIACGGIIVIEDQQCIEIKDNNNVIKFTLLNFKLSGHHQVLIVESLSRLLKHYTGKYSKKNYIQQYYIDRINALKEAFANNDMLFTNTIVKKIIGQNGASKVNYLLQHPVLSTDIIYSLIRKDSRINSLVKDANITRENLPTLIVKNDIVEYKEGVNSEASEQIKQKKKPIKKIEEQPDFNKIAKVISDSIFENLNTLHKDRNSSLQNKVFELDEYIENFFNNQTNQNQFVTQYSSSSSSINLNQNATTPQSHQTLSYDNDYQYNLNNIGRLYASNSSNQLDYLPDSNFYSVVGNSSQNYMQPTAFSSSSSESSIENYMEFYIDPSFRDSIKNATLSIFCFDEFIVNGVRRYKCPMLPNVEIVEIADMNISIAGALDFRVYALLNTNVIYAKNNIIKTYNEYNQTINNVIQLKNITLNDAIVRRRVVSSLDEFVLLPNIYLLNGGSEACALFARMSMENKNKLISLISSNAVKIKLHKNKDPSKNTKNSMISNDNDLLPLDGSNNIIDPYSEVSNIDSDFFNILNNLQEKDIDTNDHTDVQQQSKRMKFFNES